MTPTGLASSVFPTPDSVVLSTPGKIALSVAVAVGIAAALDSLFAEPPVRVHPVALFGRAIAPVDRSWPVPRLVGLAIAVVAPLIAAFGVAAVVVGSAWIARVAGLGSGGVLATATLATGVLLFTTISLRLLLATVEEVVELSESDLDRARRRLRALAGRDAETLTPAQVRSAAIESAAENLSDGLVAPLVGFVGGVALGGVLAVVGESIAVGIGGSLPSPILLLGVAAGVSTWVKAVNTLDSMLGYPHKPIGWAPARLDDLVMWLPARCCAVVVALAATDPDAVRRAREHARTPASPNAGWPMATLAAVLGVRLEKPGYYTLTYGPALPGVADATRGVAIVRRAGWLVVGFASVSAGVVGWLVTVLLSLLAVGGIPWF